ncbi:amino acid transporter [Nitratiruptor sp. SB155-2]|nr:amino acid transporter [Nitratiruptor sp. SB155-2]
MGEPSLKRAVTLPYLIFYGAGNIIGAGIYVLIGKIAQISGNYAPFSFILACFAVLFTALCYAELAARYPYASAEAYYLKHAFSLPNISTLVGFIIILTGILSSSAIISGFYGYLRPIVDIGEFLTLFLTLLFLTGIAIWGVKESVTLTALFTLIEIFGLVLIIFYGFSSIDMANVAIERYIPPLKIDIWIQIALGSFLAFYAFIGFEDIVKLSEEVVDVQKTMPKAIIITLFLVTVLYILIAFVSVTAIDPQTLGKSDAPLDEVFKKLTGGESHLLGIIALFAIINGVLVQIIMVSRMLYGLAKQKNLPQFLATIHPRTRTPLYATIITGLFILLFAYFIDLVKLAELTSYGLFIVFILINMALIKIKRQEPYFKGFKVPISIPFIALFINVLLLCIKLFSDLYGFGSQ